MPWDPLVLSIAVILVAAHPASGRAQERLHDHRDAGSVEVQKLVTLQFRNLNVAPDISTLVFRLPDGGWGATCHLFGGTVPLFSATGSPTRTLGRPGPGPGEFKNPRWGAAIGKELWVVDPGNNRITAFGEDGTVIGDRTIPGEAFWEQPLPEGRGLLLSGYFGRSHTVARVSMNAADDQLGGNPSTSRNFYVDEQLAAQTSSGEVWAVAGSGGRIDILKADDLQLLATTQLPEDLSQPEAQVFWDYGKERPPPFISGVMADSAGVLWIVAQVADANWRPGLKAPADAERIGDTLVLAVSTEARTIVAAMRLDRNCEPVINGVISCTNERAMTVDVLALHLKR